MNKLGRIIKAHKDFLPKTTKKNVLYKHNCKDYNASYVGQTNRKLKTKINEYHNHINRNTTNHSVITVVHCNKVTSSGKK